MIEDTSSKLITEDEYKLTLIERINKKAEVKMGAMSYKNYTVDDLLKVLSAIESPGGSVRRLRGTIR